MVGFGPKRQQFKSRGSPQQQIKERAFIRRKTEEICRKKHGDAQAGSRPYIFRELTFFQYKMFVLDSFSHE